MINSQEMKEIGRDLFDINIIADEIVEYTSYPPAIVWKNIANELVNVGYNVNQAAEKYKVTKFAFNDQMIDLYTKSDGFIYESLIESRNPYRFAKWMNVINYLLKIDSTIESRRNKRILLYGDSVGTDSIFLARLGYQVYYHDFESFCSKFAEYRFAKRQIKVNKFSKGDKNFDYIICLEVAEHVPNPPELVQEISEMISNNGFCFFSEAFELLRDNFPTHLESNQKYIGKTEELFLNNNMYLCWKDIHNKPYVFSKKKPVRGMEFLKKVSRKISHILR
jgi:2-polyprenyl-3-methyl-5-hydroxy-6-metoxy-1,4-benzoquinol methylase